jgi:hypothetical protein
MKTFLFGPIWFSTSFLSILNAFKVSNLTLKKNIHVLLLKSSIKLIKYFDLDNDDVDIGLHKFVCTNCSGDVVLNKAILGNLSLVCLLYRELTHIGLTHCNLGIPTTKFH